MSIYSSLFSYRPRPGRLPTEDFLTAALADLLNRLPRDEHVSFVGEVLLGPSAAGEDWRSEMVRYPQARLRWVTQQAAVDEKRSGFADLVLLVDGVEAVVVENKVAANVRSHGSEPSEEASLVAQNQGEKATAEEFTQLTTYGRWLAKKRNGKPFLGALVFLTHLTEPPSDFGSAAYGQLHGRVCRWNAIWRWACDAAARHRETGSDLPVWMQLASELAAFLERLGMTGSGMTLNDAFSIGAIVEMKGRTDRTHAVIAGRLSSLAVELGSTGISAFTNTDSMSSLWSWFYLKPRSLGWFVGWGLRIHGRTTHWSDFKSFPSGPHAFVMLGTDKQPVPMGSLGDERLPPGWMKLDTEIAVIRELHSFETDGEGFSEQLAKWIAAEISAIRPTLAELANQRFS